MAYVCLLLLVDLIAPPPWLLLGAATPPKKKTWPHKKHERSLGHRCHLPGGGSGGNDLDSASSPTTAGRSPAIDRDTTGARRGRAERSSSGGRGAR